MPSWFHCDRDSGIIVAAGFNTSVEDANANTAPEGRSLYVLADGLVADPYAQNPDFSLLKRLLCQNIDLQASQSRLKYITDVPGQAQTYEKKEAEARSWGADADEADFPFLTAEANGRGLAIVQVRDEIMAQVNALVPLAAKIEAHRVAAKKAICDAIKLPAILAAASVNWEQVEA